MTPVLVTPFEMISDKFKDQFTGNEVTRGGDADET
jgi:hypothetical protein